MKQTKANVIRLLEAMVANEDSMTAIFKRGGYEEAAQGSVLTSMAYQSAIWCLTNKDYFDAMCEAMELSE